MCVCLGGGGGGRGQRERENCGHLSNNETVIDSEKVQDELL